MSGPSGEIIGSRHPRGYLLVSGRRPDGTRFCTGAHAIVCETFHGPRPPGKQVAHKNGVPDDNHPDNLEWKTPVANNADKWRHGTDWNQTRKLVAEDVHEIREGLAADEPVASLAERFGVTAGTIRHIRRGHTWSHLPARPITGSYDRRPGQT